MGQVYRFRRPRHRSMLRTTLRFAVPSVLFAAAFGLVHALLTDPEISPGKVASSVRDFVTASSITTLNRNEHSRSPAALDVSAIDGDSLRGSGGHFRIMDIDAPELRQTCRDAQGRDWACGRAAHRRLAELSSKGALACRERGRDRYGRTLADCSVNGVRDIGETLVREGLALDFGRGAYAAAEREARSAKRGIWGGDFKRPNNWRKDNPGRQHWHR